MGDLAESKTLSREEYLAMERASTGKHEFFAGEVFAMAGGTREHNLLAGNALALLWNALRERDCEVYNSDQRVFIPATRQYVYPDVAVVCGGPRFEDEVRDVLLNPSVVIEVLSDGTERYDRGKKFEGYRTIDSLRDYLLVAQDAVRVEHFTREDGGSWRLRVYGRGQALALDACEVQLPVDELYARVRFDDP